MLSGILLEKNPLSLIRVFFSSEPIIQVNYQFCLCCMRDAYIGIIIITALSTDVERFSHVNMYKGQWDVSMYPFK